MKSLKSLMIAAAMGLLGFGLFAADAPVAKGPYTVAIFPFTETGAGVKDMGEQVSMLLYPAMMTDPEHIIVVDRKDLEKSLDENKLSMSGMTNPAEATKAGFITGAKIIITGSVFKVQDKTFIIAKVMGTETSRIISAPSIHGTETIDLLAQKAGEAIVADINKKAADAMPKIKTEEDVITSLKSKIPSTPKSKIFVLITERHVSSASMDPALQTEMQHILKALGFELASSESDADIIIKGEAFSELAYRYKEVLSVKGRAEITVTDRSGVIIAKESRQGLAVGLAELMLSKDVFQKLGADLAEVVIPKLAQK